MRATHGRIWEAASNSDQRPVLKGVIFDAEAGTLTATDSYIAARVPCEVEEGDESGIIPAEAIKEAAGQSLYVAGGKATLKLHDGERTWALIEGTPPKVDEVLASARKAANPVGLNSKLLAKLGAAMRNGSPVQGDVVLHPTEPRKAILVTSPYPDVQGVIMPVVLPDHGPHAPAAKQADLADDRVVLAGVEAAAAALRARRGKRKAAQAFRDAIERASDAA